MENAAQIISKIQRDQNNTLNDLRFKVIKTEPNEPVKGLCMNCSNFPGCTFPMRGRALFCEEYE